MYCRASATDWMKSSWRIAVTAGSLLAESAGYFRPFPGCEPGGLLRSSPARPEGPRRSREAFALHVPRPPPAATASSFTYAQRPPGHDGARLAAKQRSKLRSTGTINHRRSPSNGPPATGHRRAELARLRTFRTTAYSEAPGGGALWS